MALALADFNAAFKTGVAMPIMDVDVRNLADLAELRGRKDIAELLRDALQLCADEQEQEAAAAVR